MTPLEILEAGAKEAEAALADLKALWEREDEATKANRAAVLEAHAQGARDRDEVRKAMGGVSVVEAEKAAAAAKEVEDKAKAEEARKVEDAAITERARQASDYAATAPRASSLPVTPLAALDQKADQT